MPRNNFPISMVPGVKSITLHSIILRLHSENAIDRRVFSNDIDHAAHSVSAIQRALWGLRASI
jgi:hypothetical protein